MTAAMGALLLGALVAGGLAACSSGPEELTAAEFIAQNSSLPRQLASYDAGERYEAVARLKREKAQGMKLARILLSDRKFENYRAEVVLARFLADSGDTFAIPYLIDFLEHPDEGAVNMAAEGLLAFPNEPHVFDEFSRRVASPRLRDRLVAARMLSQLRAAKAVELCAERYGVESDKEVRGLFLITVSQSRHPQRRGFLVEMLDDEDEALRQQAWWVLSRYTDFPARVRYDVTASQAERAATIDYLHRWAAANRGR